MCALVPDAMTPSGGTLPPPGPPDFASPRVASTEATATTAPMNGTAGQPPRAGRLAAAWRAVVVASWVGVFIAYMAVWKASEEIGIATWWLGPRSDPQPLLIRLVPFAVAAVFGILATYNVPRMPVIGLAGSVLLAAIAVPDLSRSTGLAVIEFAIAGAALLVSLASFTGTYRRPRSDAAG